MSDFTPWIAPPGPVVEPPVHPMTIVDVIWSDRSEGRDRARDLNWSGDGPKIIAYSVVEEYKPEPTLEQIITDTRAEIDAIFAKRFSPSAAPAKPREVVAWAEMDAIGTIKSIWQVKHIAVERALRHGGTVRPLGFLP